MGRLTGFVKQRWFLAAVLCLVAFRAAGSHAALVTEGFGTAQSALADGWLAAGNGLLSNVAGFSNTSDAGGAAGEARALFRRSSSAALTTAFYADVALGGAVPTSGVLNASGKFDVTALSTPDFGFGAYLGYFSPSDNSRLGIIFNDSGPNLTWGLRIVTPGGGLLVSTGLDAGHVVAPNTDRTFSLAWDPSIGNGRLTGSISGAGAAQTIDLTPAQRASLDTAGFALSGFGLNLPSASSSSSGNYADFRVDDATYTAKAVTPTKTETFDSAASTASHGWTIVNPSGTQQVGVINASQAGGPAGEAQFRVFRSGTTYFADTSILRPIDFDQTFEATGEFFVDSASETGNGRYIAFFDKDGVGDPAGSVFAGIFVHDEGSTAVRLFTGNGVVWGTSIAAGNNVSLSANTPYDFAMTFDPTGGVNGLGRLSAVFTRDGAAGLVSYLDLNAALRANLAGDLLDSFGLLKLSAGATSALSDLRLDNVTYTAPVPEPSGLVLLAVASLCALGAVRRKRRRQ